MANCGGLSYSETKTSSYKNENIKKKTKQLAIKLQGTAYNGVNGLELQRYFLHVRIILFWIIFRFISKQRTRYGFC